LAKGAFTHAIFKCLLKYLWLSWQLKSMRGL
jgi:hypothetical protein